MSEEHKPECYGDPYQFDLDDPGCEECSYQQSCSIRCNRNSRSRQASSSYSSRQSFRSSESRKYLPSSKRTEKKSKSRTEVITAEAEEDDTFMSILMHNAGLEAMQSMVDELGNSIRHIPRKSYNSIWKRTKR